MFGRAREADRGRRARVGDRQHEVGLDRRLLREPLAHPHARAVHLDAGEARVRPREVEELEDAERAVLGRLDRLERTQPVLVAITSSPGRTSRSNVAPTRSSAHVSEATTGSSPSRPSTSGRKPNGSRNAKSFPSASPTTVAAPSSSAIVAATASSSGRSSSAISAAITSESEDEASGLPARSRSSSAFDEVAVVAERDGAHAPVVEERLRVLPGVAAGRRVARVADREVAVQPGEASLVEHLRHEARGRAARSAGRPR